MSSVFENLSKTFKEREDKKELEKKLELEKALGKETKPVVTVQQIMKDPLDDRIPEEKEKFLKSFTKNYNESYGKNLTPEFVLLLENCVDYVHKKYLLCQKKHGSMGVAKFVGYLKSLVETVEPPSEFSSWSVITKKFSEHLLKELFSENTKQKKED